ncbi:MAG: bifunctional nuclease family protein [Propionibacteriaceae bacterium]|nr:bifunctional nuclease family protein [Propionibacteriaceae bacterium]
MIVLQFVEIRVTGVADDPVLLLRELDGERVLPVWTTAVGANAVLSALEGPLEERHPGIHDLLLDALARVDTVIEEVRIVGYADGVFDAAVVVGPDAVPARLTDAVALALRGGGRILADEAVMDAAALGGARAAAPGLTGASDDQLERFRAFLDTISPDDFGPDGKP